MEHSFNINIAKKVGVNAAVIFNNMYFWIEKNKANNTHFYDGKFWTYNSKRAYKELFPYMTERQIDYAITKLVEAGYVEKGNYNKEQYDRTLWYAITNFGYSILQNCEMEHTNLQNGTHNIVKPIPYINTDNKTTDRKPNIKAQEQVYYPNDEILNAAFNDYVVMRKQIKKPMTAKAVELAKKKLAELAAVPFSDNMDNDLAVKILEQSVMNSWQGLFPLKDNNNNSKPNGNKSLLDELWEV